MSRIAIRKLLLLNIFILTVPTLIKAENIFKSTSPSTVKVSLSDERKYITTASGHLLSLPEIVKETISLEWAIIKKDTISNISSIDKAEKQEILNLSEKLGVKVRNVQNLKLYREAAEWLGTRYRWAGKSKKGIDCSGLTNVLLKTVYDKDIERSSHIIANNLNEELNTDELEPGDLVFFSTRRAKRITHVGVYLGERLFIHASTRNGVIVSSLDENYYTRTFKKAGRI